MSRIKEKIKKTILYKPLRFIKDGIVHIFFPFGYIRNYIVFPIQGFLRTHHIGKEYRKYEYINSLKDIHKGKRCFILATGPSLKIEDVEKLSGEITFAVNSFYRIYNKTDFRPTYYAVLDPDVQQSVIENCGIPLNELAQKQVFFNSMNYNDNKNICFLPINYQNHWFNIFNTRFDYSKNLRFTNDLLWGIYDKYTITNCAIDIAIFMGCTEIYLLGVDCNYSGPSNYFVKPTIDTFKPNEIQAILTQKAMMTGYRFMEKETRKRGVKVFNATRGGMLEEFERVDFDTIIF